MVSIILQSDFLAGSRGEGGNCPPPLATAMVDGDEGEEEKDGEDGDNDGSHDDHDDNSVAVETTVMITV